MSKISNIKVVKENLELGVIECSYVWSLDGQSKLKGNPLKAFEKSLKTICNFEKTKKGRKTYYLIKDIYEENLPREHKNKSALKGNINRKGIISFKRDSNVEFVAAVLLNKVEYFTRCGDINFRSISSWMRVCGLESTEDKVNERINYMMNRAIEKLYKLNMIGVEVKYKAFVNNKFINISQSEFEKYTDKSRELLKKALGDDLYKVYRSYYQFRKYYKHLNKKELDNYYWKLMDCDIEFVYKEYRLYDILECEKSENEVYLRLLDVVFGEHYFEDEKVIDRIEEFIDVLGQEVRSQDIKVGF